MDTYGYIWIQRQRWFQYLGVGSFFWISQTIHPAVFAVSRGVHPAGELLVPALWWLHLEKGCEFQPFLNYELGILDITIIVPN